MSLEIPPGVDLSKVPMLPNPNGTPPNFENSTSLKPVTWSVTIFLIVWSTFCVLLRLHTNYRMHKKLATDDWFGTIAWVLSIVYGVVVMLSTSTAQHIWDVPITAVDAAWVKKCAVLGTIYGPAMWFAKTAVLTLYLRLFNVYTWVRWACYIGIGFTCLAYWSLVPVSVVYNFPHGPNERWDLAMTVGSAPAQVPFVIMGVISVVSDVYIFVLPLPVLLRLHVSWRRKLGLCLVFMTAIIGIVSSCFVLYFRVILWKNKTLDTTWNVAASYLTVVVELNIAVIVSCAPAIASSWKLLLRDSGPVIRLRSAYNTSKNSLFRIMSGEKPGTSLQEPVE